MSINNKITVVLWAIMALSLTGCTQINQFGKNNTVHVKQSSTSKAKSFNEVYPNGRSLQQAIRDKAAGRTYGD